MKNERKRLSCFGLVFTALFGAWKMIQNKIQTLKHTQLPCAVACIKIIVCALVNNPKRWQPCLCLIREVLVYLFTHAISVPLRMEFLNIVFTGMPRKSWLFVGYLGVCCCVHMTSST